MLEAERSARGPARRPRGRTAPGRLAALDRYLLATERSLLSAPHAEASRAWVVDVGIGETPVTTLELADALAQIEPPPAVLAVEVDAERAERARRFARERFEVRRGGFDLPLHDGEAARLVRCMNVLRGLPPDRVPEVHAELGSRLLVGGLLLEGSSDRAGDVLTAHLLRREPEGLRREALLFFTNGRRGFAPILFRDHLPRDLRRAVKSGHPLHAFFVAWTAAWTRARERGIREPRAAFAASAALLAATEPSVDAAHAEQGYLVWAQQRAPML